MVVDPAAIADMGDDGLRLLYIALTRATKYLAIVHAHAFDPLGLEGVSPEAVPEPTNLERILYADGKVGATRLVTAPPDSEPATTTNPLPSDQQLSPVLAAVSQSLADQIRDGVPPQKWGEVLADLQRRFERSALVESAQRARDSSHIVPGRVRRLGAGTRTSADPVGLSTS